MLSYAQNVHERAKEAGGSFRAVWGDHDVDNVPKLLPKPFVPPEWFSLMLVRTATPYTIAVQRIAEERHTQSYTIS